MADPFIGSDNPLVVEDGNTTYIPVDRIKLDDTVEVIDSGIGFIEISASGAVKGSDVRSFRYSLIHTDVPDATTYTFDLLDVPSNRKLTIEKAGIHLSNGGSIPSGLQLVLDEISGTDYVIDQYNDTLNAEHDGQTRFVFRIENSSGGEVDVGAFVDIILEDI